ncbi:hypothetical protein [Arthrobacter sp. CJ23]|nr:hypothetical protein [Arthrobacter sp. CJ23]UVJ41253.1 hypothetical protein NVV90_08935 [Arthrobacter sp. CJ23]
MTDTNGHARRVRGDVKLVGGAALILQGVRNRPTAGIDATTPTKRPWTPS